ncbi:MAG: glycoside hydrolase family 172 protein [bacterium]
MKKCSVIVAAALFFFMSSNTIKAEGEKVTYASLINDMVSLTGLCRAFPAGTDLVQFSSYDRGSKTRDGKPNVRELGPDSDFDIRAGEDVLGWWSNSDLGNYLRKEKTERGFEYVMAESDRPGAIVRMWSANPAEAVWRIYIDGSEEPAIEASGEELLGGEVSPWSEPFTGRRNRGYNHIFPLPFAESIKVTAAHPDEKAEAPMMFYHVDLRLYPKGTRVEPFSWEVLEELEPKIFRVSRILSEPDQHYPYPDGKQEKANVSLSPGQSEIVLEPHEPAALTRLEILVHASQKELPRVLAKTMIAMTWDNEDMPSVAVPMGDFFGAYPGAPEMESLPCSIRASDNGAELISRWVMPFRKKARISLHNMSDLPLEADVEATVSDFSFGPDSLYFNAGFYEKNRIMTRPFQDLTMADIHGRGHFVGLEMNVNNHVELFWWGEGDEKIWVDDDDFPSIFGTGTEDYFGYAWGFQFLKFTHAYHGIPVPTRESVELLLHDAIPVPGLWEKLSLATEHAAAVSQYRWQILDAIPFDSSLRFDMELWHQAYGPVDVNATSYWYARPGSKSQAGVPDLKGRKVWKASWSLLH